MKPSNLGSKLSAIVVFGASYCGASLICGLKESAHVGERRCQTTHIPVLPNTVARSSHRRTTKGAGVMVHAQRILSEELTEALHLGPVFVEHLANDLLGAQLKLLDYA